MIDGFRAFVEGREVFYIKNVIDSLLAGRHVIAVSTSTNEISEIKFSGSVAVTDDLPDVSTDGEVFYIKFLGMWYIDLPWETQLVTV